MTETEYLLVVLAEECNEVAKETLKAMRFGLSKAPPERFQPEQLDNTRRIEAELGDLMAIVELLGFHIHESDKADKLVKIAKYMEISRNLGVLKA